MKPALCVIDDRGLLGGFTWVIQEDYCIFTLPKKSIYLAG